MKAAKKAPEELKAVDVEVAEVVAAPDKYLSAEHLAEIKAWQAKQKDLSQQREIEELKLALGEKEMQLLVANANEQVKKLRDSALSRQKAIESLKLQEIDLAESRRISLEAISFQLGFEGKVFGYDPDTLKVSL